VTDGATAMSAVSHDGLGRATSLTAPSTETASLGYDDGVRALSVTGFGSGAGTHEQTYDPRGRLASYTPPAVSGAEAGTTGYSYDADGVLRTLTLPSGARVGATTDAAGRPASLALAAGDLTLSYDPATGQLDSLHMANTAGAQDVALSYDGPLLSHQRFTGASTADVDYAYDDALRVSRVTIVGEPVAYDYDRDGLVTQAGSETLTRDPDSGVVTSTRAGSVRQIYATSGLLELNQHSAVWSGGGRFNETVDARDGAGRILEKTETTSAGTSFLGYAYDDDGRVTEERQGGVRIASYEYDAQGNRTALHRYDAVSGAEVESRTTMHDARDRLTSDGVASYTYDAAGRRATRTTAGAVTSYAYDELGHLVSVTVPSGTMVEYTYDALGRRTGRTTDGAVDGPLDTAWVYSSGPAPVAKLDGLGTVQAVFVYGTRSWVPDVIVIPDAGGARAELAVVTDHRGSVRALVNTATGDTVGPIDYDAYGRVRGAAPAILSYYGFSFAGGLLDPATGLVHLGARDYDPETGTWIEPDPIRFAGGDTNLYAYVGADPVNGVDPSGRTTLQVGVVIDVCFLGVCGSLSVGPVVGFDGTVAPLNISGSFGAATQPGSVDLSVFGEYTNACSVDDLEGMEVFGGVGFGEEVTGAVDYFRGVGTSNPDNPYLGQYEGLTYSGVRAQVGVGAGLSPLDAHGGATVSVSPLRAAYRWIKSALL